MPKDEVDNFKIFPLQTRLRRTNCLLPTLRSFTQRRKAWLSTKSPDFGINYILSASIQPSFNQEIKTTDGVVRRLRQGFVLFLIFTLTQLGYIET